MTTTKSTLPPGSNGLPLLGETHLLLRDGFGFVEERARRHGPIFRTRILGRPTAVITGPDATALFIDAGKVQREGSMPAHIQTLFGGHALPVLDGDVHRERKQFIMAAFSADALAAYLPTLERLTADHFRRWTAAGELRWSDELERLSLEAIGETLMGIPPGARMDELRALYATFFRGFGALPIPLPGTAFWRARRIVRRLLAIHRANVDEHLADRSRDDGLSRILAAKSPLTGAPPAPDDVARELHHLVIAGLIVRRWMATLILELGRNPEVRARLVDEIARAGDDTGGSLTLARLEQMPYLTQVSDEVRRLSPVVHVFFGKAREAIEFAGYTIPAGWSIFWGIRASHIAPQVYPDPLRFDPERFSPARAEQLRHPHAFAPNGAGGALGHKCAGYELAPIILRIFALELLRRHDWTLSPAQDLEPAWNQVPPMPRDGLRARVTVATAQRASDARSG
ncbi:MAG TPA: cytochrome P450 [Polyangia bacterium]|nr:cytochrome P450 [Polyangia bacterium]